VAFTAVGSLTVKYQARSAFACIPVNACRIAIYHCIGGNIFGHPGPRPDERVVADRAAGGSRRLTMPLAVVTDLILREVPIATAATIVVSLTKAGVRDADLALFQRNVRLDIQRGADPSTSATTRAHGTILRSGTGAKP